MTFTILRRAFLTLPSLALAAVLLIHPGGDGDRIFEDVSPVVDDWITVHVALLFGFPLLALATFVLLHGLGGRAAATARAALVAFAVFYTAWEVMVGLATGVLADSANSLAAAEQAGAATAIQDLNGHWITQVALVLGALGWAVAIAGTAVAVRGAGVRWPALALLVPSIAFAVHPPPVGPVALVCFAGGALLVDRARTRVAAEPVREASPAPAV